MRKSATCAYVRSKTILCGARSPRDSFVAREPSRRSFRRNRNSWWWVRLPLRCRIEAAVSQAQARVKAGPSSLNTPRILDWWSKVTKGPSGCSLLDDPCGLGHDVRRHLLTVSSRHVAGEIRRMSATLDMETTFRSWLDASGSRTALRMSVSMRRLREP